MATSEYCANMAEELEVWITRLHQLSDRIDHIPSIQKYHLQPLIEELHIVMTELDDILCEMVTACPTVEAFNTEEKVRMVELQKNSGELFDYDFGG